MLEKAVELRPNDFTALSYLNLMYREKADVEKSAADREADLQKAEELTQRALGIRKQETEKASAAR